MSRLSLITLLLLSFALVTSAEEKAKPSPAEIQRLIKQLGSERFAEREAARKALEAIGEPALDALRQAAKVNDLEVRRRAERLVEAVEARLYRALNCFRGHTASVFSVAFSPDGKRLLSGSHDKTIRLWDVQTGKELCRFESHRDLVYAVVFSPDGRRILSGSADNTVRLCDVKTGNELRCLKGHASIVYAVAFSPDGKRVASAGHDKTVRLWDVATGKELHHFEGHPFYAFNSVVFSPEGKQLAAGSGDATVRLWDVETGEELRCFRGHRTAVNAVAFSADGKWILSGCGNQEVSELQQPNPDWSLHLWDVKSGKELRRFNGHNGHQGFITCVAFSPDGKRILSGGDDNTIRLWDVQSGKELHCFQGHTHRVISVAFSPDGRRVLSGSGDKTVRLWSLPPTSVPESHQEQSSRGHAGQSRAGGPEGKRQ